MGPFEVVDGVDRGGRRSPRRSWRERAALVALGLFLAAGDLQAQTPIFRRQVLLRDAAAFSTGTQDIRFEGAAARRQMGSAIAAGDLNGDGFQDLAVGERKSNRVYVYFGRRVLNPAGANPTDPGAAYIVRPLASATNDVPDVSITCGGCQLDPGNNSDFGFSLAAGDVTDDAFADLIIGAPFDDAGAAAGADSGRAFIVEGRGVWPAVLDADTDARTHRITAASGANTRRYYQGFAMAVGDFDADGIGDIALSSRGASFPLYSATIISGSVGAVHLIPGASFGATIDLASDAGVRHIAGNAGNEFVGESLAFCNVDGTPGQDLLVGAIHTINISTGSPLRAGGMYIFTGTTLAAAPGGTTNTSVAAASLIRGAGRGDALGFKVACGDLNGDGFDDPFVSAIGASGKGNARSGSGEIFGFYGQAAIPDPNFPALRDLSADSNGDGIPDEADLWILGATPGDQLGFSLSAGNVNCDTDPNTGRPLVDIVAGARRYDSLNPSGRINVNAGITYAIRGSETRPRKTVMDLGEGTGLAPGGSGPPTRLADFPQTASDGLGHPACDPNTPDDPNAPCAIITVVKGDLAHSQTGFSVAAGDFNGDGCAEVAVGAVGDLRRVTRRSPGYSGRAYLVSFQDFDRDGVSDLSDQDNDNDCLADTLEDVNGNGVFDITETDRLVNDTDQDGLQDGTEKGIFAGSSPSPATLRGEVIFSGTDCSLINPAAPMCCLDRDAGATNTDPLNPDTDGDTILDGGEDSDHNGELCGDLNHNGVIGAAEIICERDANRTDTDGDGLDDNHENLGGCPSPFDADSDDDGIPDACIDGVNGAPFNGTCTDPREGEDLNKNGAKDSNETNSCLADTDGDGLQDGTEVAVSGPGVPGPNAQLDTGSGQDGTDPTRHRPDLDANTGTDPLNIDTDNDCLPDGCIAGFFGGGPCPPVNPNLPVLQGEDVNLNGRTDGFIAGSASSPAAGTETDPFDRDTDSDGLDDGLEWGVTAGVCPQKDLDPASHTDPRDSDSDNGSVADGLEDINANGRVDFNPGSFLCGAVPALDVNNETNPATPLDDRGADFSRTPAPGFADPNNAAVTAYLQNKTLAVLLDDTDENKDPNTAELIVLSASNVVDPNNPLIRQGVSCLVDDPNVASNVDNENLTLTETGPNTHVFRGILNMSTAAGAVQDGSLNCVEDDRVRFAYRDDDDLCDQRAGLADVTLTQIRLVNPPLASPPITTPVTSVSAIFKEDLACASVTSGDFSVAGTGGPAVPASITCAPDPGFPQFGNRRVTLNFGAPLPDDLYAVTLDCDAPAPFITDMSGFLADCERPCSLPPGGNPVGYCAGVLSGDGSAGGTFAYQFVVDNDPRPSIIAMSPPPNSSVAGVTQVTVTFDQPMDPITLTTSSFTVVGTTAGNVVATVTYNAITRTATASSLTPFPLDTYTVTVKGTGAAAVRDLAGNLLDGEFAGTFPSGNGIQGGDFIATFSATGTVKKDPGPITDALKTQATPKGRKKGAGSVKN